MWLWIKKIWNDSVLSKLIATAIISFITTIWAKISSSNYLLIISIIIFFAIILIILIIIGAKKGSLQKFGSNTFDTRLDKHFSSTGNPSIRIISDGYHGNLFVVQGNFSRDELDWNINPSAYKATMIIFEYLPEDKLIFYLRINLLNKDNSNEKLKWIRLDPFISIISGIPEENEMGYPIFVNKLNDIVKSQVDIIKAVKSTFGRNGWQFSKLIQIRARGNGKIKSIILK